MCDGNLATAVKPMSLAMIRRMGVLLGLTAALSACGAHALKTDTPAVAVRPELAFNQYPLDTIYNENMYFSKEAASGGRTLTAGGCGCN